MNIFQIKEFAEKMHPGKSIQIDLDNACICAFEQIAENGIPNLFGHIVFNRAKIIVEGMSSYYLPIEHHRQAIGIAEIKRKFSEMTDVCFPKDVMMNFDDLEKKSKMSLTEKLLLSPKEQKEVDSAVANYPKFRSDLKSSSGLDDNAIDFKLSEYRKIKT